MGIKYRFKITSKQNGNILGTGLMTSSRLLDKTEQINLFHNMTHRQYLNSESYANVDIFKIEH